MFENSNATIWNLHILFAALYAPKTNSIPLLYIGLGGTLAQTAGLAVGFSPDKIVKFFRQVSGKKIVAWRSHLEEAFKKMIEVNRELIGKEIEKIERLKRSALDNAKSKIQREKDELIDEKHPLNRWSNELGKGREVAQSIRQENDE